MDRKTLVKMTARCVINLITKKSAEADADDGGGRKVEFQQVETMAYLI